MGTHENAMLIYVKDQAEEGNAASVVEAIDTYCFMEEENWMCTIGDVKGKILDQTVMEMKPMVALELGTYCGYSALRIRRHMPKGSILITLDINETYQKVAQQVGKLAGLDGQIHYWVGDLEDNLARLQKEF